MGLLDALANSNLGGYGGLLDGIYLPSQVQPGQMQYDQMGNPIGATQQTENNFSFPNLPQPTAQPGPSQMSAQAPVFGFGQSGFSPQQMGTAMPSQIAQPAPAPQPAAPPTDMSSQNVAPTRTLDVGGYQMPQFGNAPEQAAIPQAAQPAQYQQPGTRPAFLGPQSPDLGDKLSAGLSGFGAGGKSGGLIGALTGGISGFASGQSSDPRVIAQQNLKAQYDALLPLVGPQKAMLAVMNPEAGKTILAQALEKKQYGFTKLDSDTVLRTDPLTGKAEVAFDNGDSRGTITGPDGKPIAIPAGVDRKTFVNEVSRANAKAAAGEKTEVQAKAEIFANKMELSNKTLGSLEGQGTSLTGKITSGVPLGNYAQTPEYQKYKQAASNFITALLRQESGAAIGKDEFDRYDKEYMPQPGDTPDVLAQKSEARRVAIDGMKKGAGPGYKPPTEGAAPSGFKTQTGVSWSIVK